MSCRVSFHFGAKSVDFGRLGGKNAVLARPVLRLRRECLSTLFTITVVGSSQDSFAMLRPSKQFVTFVRSGAHLCVLRIARRFSATSLLKNCGNVEEQSKTRRECGRRDACATILQRTATQSVANSEHTRGSNGLPRSHQAACRFRDGIATRGRCDARYSPGDTKARPCGRRRCRNWP